MLTVIPDEPCAGSVRFPLAEWFCEQALAYDLTVAERLAWDAVDLLGTRDRSLRSLVLEEWHYDSNRYEQGHNRTVWQNRRRRAHCRNLADSQLWALSRSSYPMHQLQQEKLRRGVLGTLQGRVEGLTRLYTSSYRHALRRPADFEPLTQALLSEISPTTQFRGLAPWTSRG